MRARALLLLPVTVVLATGLTGCGGTAELAQVGDRSITAEQVDALTEHGAEEARGEGAAFPARGSVGYRALQREALAILVARAQIEQAARRLGVTVSDAEVARYVRLPRHKDTIELVYEATRSAVGFAESEAGHEAALHAEAVRVQLTLQKVERRVGARRLGAWVAAARQLRVDYADGWRP